MEMESIHSHGENSLQKLPQDVRLVYAGLNRRWRIYRYAPGGRKPLRRTLTRDFHLRDSPDEMELVWDTILRWTVNWTTSVTTVTTSATADKIVSSDSPLVPQRRL
jgi:hypothetical protein